MRITEGRMIEANAAAVEKARSKVFEDSQKVQTGIAVAKPSDDQAAWAQGARAQARLAMSESRGTTIGRAQDRLAENDRALGGITTGLTRVRELAVQLSNGIYSAEERTAAAAEVRALRDMALGLANLRGTDGEYVFAGTASGAAPFDAAGAYQGNANRRQVEVAEGQKLVVTIPGTVLTAASGVDVLPLMETLAAALEANDPTAVVGQLENLDAAISQVASARADVGGRMSALYELDDIRQGHEIALASQKAHAVEADAIKSAVDLNRSSSALQQAVAVTEKLLSVISGR